MYNSVLCLSCILLCLCVCVCCLHWRINVFIIVTAFIRVSLCLFMCKLAFHLLFPPQYKLLTQYRPSLYRNLPVLFYNLFVTQNETKSGPFKASFFSLQCLKYWVKGKICQFRRINPKSYERFSKKKRPISVNFI